MDGSSNWHFVPAQVGCWEELTGSSWYTFIQVFRNFSKTSAKIQTSVHKYISWYSPCCDNQTRCKSWRLGQRLPRKCHFCLSRCFSSPLHNWVKVFRISGISWNRSMENGLFEWVISSRMSDVSTKKTSLVTKSHQFSMFLPDSLNFETWTENFLEIWGCLQAMHFFDSSYSKTR